MKQDKSIYFFVAVLFILLGINYLIHMNLSDKVEKQATNSWTQLDMINWSMKFRNANPSIYWIPSARKAYWTPDWMLNDATWESYPDFSSQPKELQAAYQAR
jgi:hypothetical protein